ncbi:MAG: protease modulator HflK [Novosphingobium sp.]
MAGRRSPWGGGDNEGGVDASGDAPSPDGAGDEPVADTPTPPGGPPRGPRNPWLPTGDTPPRRSPSIEDIFRNRDKRRTGGRKGSGGFPKFPQRPGGKSWVPLIAVGLPLAWLALTSTHMVGPKEQGVVTTFGKYSHTIVPGVSLTAPWPIQNVKLIDVTSIKRDTIPEGEAERLMLTSDQNLVDLSYLVRWSIKDLKLYSFQLSDPDGTVREVAEAAMRASVAELPLREAMGGAGRAEMEQSVRARMQSILDAYRAGVQIQGVEIKKADPPAKTVSAFQQVTAAQQDAQRDRSNAQAWAEQLTARAQGDAAGFDKVYEQYKLSPEVTKRRMYYETMERVLANNDKVVVEANGVTPYLPLPQMVRKAPNADAGTGAASAGGGK